MPACCTVGRGERTQPLAHFEVLGPNASTFTFVPLELRFRVDSTITCTEFFVFVPASRTDFLNAREEY